MNTEYSKEALARSITVNPGYSFGGEREPAGVNWSGIGTSSAEVTRLYALELLRAADVADALNSRNVFATLETEFPGSGAKELVRVLAALATLPDFESYESARDAYSSTLPRKGLVEDLDFSIFRAARETLESGEVLRNEALYRFVSREATVYLATLRR